jgi:short-subunit dehydrogenase
MSSSDTKPIAVISGASSGIGAVYADRFAARGYDVVLVARRADRLGALAQTISRVHHVNAEVVIADLANESDLARVERILATNPAVRVLVNSAGLMKCLPMATSTLQDSLLQIALNITSLTRLTHAVLPAFLSRNDGMMINISSVLAIHEMPISASTVYNGTKAFVLNFSRSLQSELARTGVKVQVVLPAQTATEIWDNSGMSLSILSPDTVLSAETLVDAALAGLDKGESVTWPTVADATLCERYDVARSKLFAATQAGKPAPRYISA